MSATDLPDDDELLAAELAFGLIDGADKQTAERRLDGDAAFTAAYDRWLAYGAAMFTDTGEAPRPSVWTTIEARLPANDAVPSNVSRSTLRWWQGGTAVASAAAVVLAIVAMQPAPRPTSPPPAAAPQPSVPLVAVLTGDKGVVTVSYDRTSKHITAAPNGMNIGDHSPELWVIPADGKPRSLGLIAVDAPLWTKAPDKAAVALTAGVTLAVSVEPLGGSPTGQPTGPVILTGKLRLS